MDLRLGGKAAGWAQARADNPDADAVAFLAGACVVVDGGQHEGNL